MGLRIIEAFYRVGVFSARAFIHVQLCVTERASACESVFMHIFVYVFFVLRMPINPDLHPPCNSSPGYSTHLSE